MGPRIWRVRMCPVLTLLPDTVNETLTVQLVAAIQCVQQRNCPGEGLVEFGLDLGAAVEGQPQVVTAAADLVLDLDAPLDPVEPDRAAMGRRRVERLVTIVLGRPAGYLAPVGYLGLRGPGVPDPQEGTALGRLVTTGEFHRVVRDRRAEV